jgi:hypothetical protein
MSNIIGYVYLFTWQVFCLTICVAVCRLLYTIKPYCLLHFMLIYNRLCWIAQYWGLDDLRTSLGSLIDVIVSSCGTCLSLTFSVWWLWNTISYSTNYRNLLVDSQLHQHQSARCIGHFDSLSLYYNCYHHVRCTLPIACWLASQILSWLLSKSNNIGDACDVPFQVASTSIDKHHYF